MAGLSSIQSKIRYMSTLTTDRVRSREQSVVYMNDDGSIDWPENPNSSGVLCVPCPCKTLAEWQARVDNNS